MSIKIKYILLFEGRTGSTMLEELLNQNPSVTCFNEKAGQLFDQGWTAQQEWILAMCRNPFDLEGTLMKASAEAVGFRIKLRETANPEGLRQIIEAEDFRVIYMTRSNIIKQVVSSIRAIDLYRNSGVYNIPKYHASLEVPGAYPIPPERFKEIFAWLDQASKRLDDFIDSLQANVFHLTYERLISNMEEAVKDVCAFLDVPSAPFETKTRKITHDDLSHCISNYEELRSLYHHTPYYDMF